MGVLTGFAGIVTLKACVSPCWDRWLPREASTGWVPVTV
jgi:hypothetical protein